MKKWMYVIIPGAMLAIFLAFYIPHINQAAQNEKDRLEKAKQMQEAETARKAALAEASRADAHKHALEAAAADAAKQAEKEAKYAAAMAKIKADTDRYNQQADRDSKKIAALEIELEELHRTKENETRAEFDLEKRVELATVQKQDAELEIARTVQMIANRADESAMAKMPAPVVTPPSS